MVFGGQQQDGRLPLTLLQDRTATVQMLSATNIDGLHSTPRSRTAQHNPTEDPTPQPQSDAVTPDVTDMPNTTPKTTHHR